MDIDTFKDYFSAVGDSRQSAKVTYPLFNLLFASLCAVIGGSRRCHDIREYIVGHHYWFKNRDIFKSGIPTDDTIARAISSIEPNAFHACFIDQNEDMSVYYLTIAGMPAAKTFSKKLVFMRQRFCLDT